MAPTKNQIAATMTRAEAAKAGVLTFDSPSEVASVISSNSRKLFGFTRKMLPHDLPSDPKMYIFSVSEYGAMGPDAVNLGPGFPLFEIPPCPDGKDHGDACVVLPLYFMEEAKVDVTEHTFHSGAQIIEAILKIGAGMNASWDRRKVGWFVSETNPPQAEDVLRAISIYTADCQRLFAEGNRYASANQLNEINETHRRAAKFLRQKVDWDKRTSKMVDCPGCGEPVKEGVVWHATPHGCGYIFDQKRYDEHFDSKGR